jgi:hypothetical protein
MIVFPSSLAILVGVGLTIRRTQRDDHYLSGVPSFRVTA